MGTRSILIKAVFFIFLMAMLSSCSDTAPQISSVNAVVIFDYEDETNVPKSRISVFAETSEVQRVKELRAVHEASGLEWTVTSPRKIGGKDARSWAGYTNLVAASGSTIPTGKYNLYYEDAAERECESSFMVGYPSTLTKSKASDIPGIFTNGYTENIALYGSDGTLLYYGKRKVEWSSKNAIRGEFQLAEKMRICYSISNGTVVCMLPPISLVEDKTVEKAKGETQSE